MLDETAAQLTAFTQRYCQHWQTTHHSAPHNTQLLGIDSPCLLATHEDSISWQPQPFTLPKNLDAVSTGVDLVIQPSVVTFYTTQFAAEMSATFAGKPVTLLQVWNEEDFTLLQQNLLGHLVMKRRLKHSPTLFIATTDDDSTIVSVDNLTGEVVLEQLGKRDSRVLASTLGHFLEQLHPFVENS